MARSRISRCSTVLVGYVFFTGCMPPDEGSRNTQDSVSELAATCGPTMSSGAGESGRANVACAATACPLSGNNFAVLWHANPPL